MGRQRGESSDYPDYAQAVAQSVAQRKAEFGVLICTTGVGMSIAANKVPGVRAALVGDEPRRRWRGSTTTPMSFAWPARTTRRRRPGKSSMRFSTRAFEGGRHERRVNKMETRIIPTDLRLQRG